MNLQLNAILILAVLSVLGLLILSSGLLKPEMDLESLTAEEVLERWAEALGGIEAIGAIETLHSVGELETSGFSGLIEIWSTTSGQHRVHVDLGEIYRTTVISDGPSERGWVVDLSGAIQPLGGSEYADEVTNAFLESYSHFIPDRWDGVVNYLGEDGKAGHYILEIAPTDGEAIKYYIDHNSFLPAKTESLDEDGRVVTTTLGDWREVSGIMFSFRSLQTTGNPLFNTKITTEQISINTPMDAMAFAEPAEAAPDFVFAAGWQSTGIPIEISNNHIYLQTSINGSEPRWFLLDSGAGITVLNEDIADVFDVDLQGNVEGTGTGEGSVEVSLASGVRVSVQGVEIADQTVAAISLSEFEQFVGRPLYGILGSGFFNRFVVDIDYENELLGLYDPKEYSYQGAGQAIPLIFEGSNPHFEALISVAGQQLRGKFTVDTGSTGSVGLARPFVEKHDLLNSGIDLIPSPFGLGVGGESRSMLGRLDSLRLGNFKFDNVIAGFSQNEAGSMSDPNAAGIIGAEILRRFHVVFDYSNQVIYLEPNGDQSDAFDSNMSGLVLRSDGADFDQFFIFRLVDGGPADMAGLRVDDQIISIDGRLANEFTQSKIVELFSSEAGRKFVLGVRRGNEELEIELTLERQI